MDSKRQKLKERLEKGERRHEEELFNKVDEEAKLAQEIDRLRKEGSRQLAEEQELLRRRMTEEVGARAGAEADRAGGRVKVRWDRKLQPYDRAGLETIFSKYGDVTAVVVNAKKGGSALVEFASLREAKMAAAIEQGLPANKLSVKPLWEPDSGGQGPGSQGVRESGSQGVRRSGAREEEVSNRYWPWHPLLSNGCLSNDFESLVMRRLRQEEERKRLIAEMEREDREGS